MIVPAVSFMEPASTSRGRRSRPQARPSSSSRRAATSSARSSRTTGSTPTSSTSTWANPLSSTFTGPQKITVSPYHFLCDGQLTQCVPQPGTRRRGSTRRATRSCTAPSTGSANGVESMVMLQSIDDRDRSGRRALVRAAPRRATATRTSTSRARTRRTTTTAGWGARHRPQGRHRARVLLRRRAVHPADRDHARGRAGGGRDEHQGHGRHGSECELRRPARKINIGTGTTLEPAIVEAVGTAGAGGTGIDLTAPLMFAHASCNTVSNAAFVCSRAGLRAGRPALHGAHPATRSGR